MMIRALTPSPLSLQSQGCSLSRGATVTGRLRRTAAGPSMLPCRRAGWDGRASRSDTVDHTSTRRPGAVTGIEVYY
jgi:hypothetical protein